MEFRRFIPKMPAIMDTNAKAVITAVIQRSMATSSLRLHGSVVAESAASFCTMTRCLHTGTVAPVVQLPCNEVLGTDESFLEPLQPPEQEVNLQGNQN